MLLHVDVTVGMSFIDSVTTGGCERGLAFSLVMLPCIGVDVGVSFIDCVTTSRYTCGGVFHCVQYNGITRRCECGGVFHCVTTTIQEGQMWRCLSLCYYKKM